MKIPTQFSSVDYHEAREEFVDSLLKIENVEGIYEAGSVSVIGLSDLDFVVFISDFWQFSDTKKYQKIISRFSNKLNSLIGDGNILLVNSSLASNIKIIDDFNMSKLYSNLEFSFVEYQDDEYNILRVIDWLPERISKIVTVSAKGHDINYFSLHGILKSLVISLTKIESLIVCDKFSYELDLQIRVLNELRYNFHNNVGSVTYANEIIKATLSLFKLSCDAINIFAEYLRRDNHIFIVEAGQSRNKFHPFHLESKKIVSIFGKKFVVSIPPVYFLCLYFQAQQKNKLSRKLEADLELGFDLNKSNYFVTEKLNKAIRKRSIFTNDLMLFLRKNKFNRGLLKYGFYLNG